MKFKYIQPRNLEEANRFSANSWQESNLLAGGTDLLGLLKQGIEPAQKLVNLKKVEGLNKVEFTLGAGLQIGALVKIADIASHPLILKHFKILSEAAQQVASPQLRNVGTLAGNLCQRPRCWYYRGDFNCLRKGGDECFAVEGENKYHCIIGGGPCYIVHPSDMAVALLALDAQLEIYAAGKTRRLPLDDFFALPQDDLFRENILKPGEIITRILVSDTPAQYKNIYFKARARQSWDFATVSIALSLGMAGKKINKARVVFGGVAPKPWLEKSVATQLIDADLSQKSIARAVTAAFSEAEPMRQNRYKIILAKNLLKQSLESL